MYECRGSGDSCRVGSVDTCCGSGDPRLGGAGARDARGQDSHVVCIDLCRGVVRTRIVGIQVADSACNSRMEVWSARMEVGNPEWKWKS